MSEDSIELACETGVPVVLAATRRAAALLEQLAEDLLVAGAEVEIVSDVEHAPSRFGEAMLRLERPAVIALCHTGDATLLGAVRAMIAAGGAEQHHVVECRIDRSAGAARTVLAAMRELVRGTVEPTLAEVIAEVRKNGEPITDTIVLPTPPPLKTPTKRRRPWAYGLVAATMAAATIVAIVVAGDPAPELVATPADTIVPAPARPVAQTRPRPRALPQLPAPTPDPPPAVELAAQGPPATPTTETHDELSVAIRQGRAVAVGRLVAHLVTGDRDWYHAMDTCRARGFWHTTDWRVPTVRELRAIARTREFADRPAWSSSRDAHKTDAAIAVRLVGGSLETRDKHATEVATICVKERA